MESPTAGWRRATNDDVPILLQMMESFCTLEHLHFMADQRHNLILSMLEQKDLGRRFVIECDGSPAGYAALCFGFSFEYMGRDAFIDELYIDEKSRGKGLGTQTMEYLIGFGEQLGLKAIHLEVDLENERAQNVYRKLGFRGKDRYLWTKWL